MICALVAACVKAPPAVAPNPPMPIQLRDASAPVASQSDVDLSRLQGRWHVIESAGDTGGSEMQVSGSRLTIGDNTFAFTAVGQGRFMLGDRPVWVHWLDFDNRTAAMGDPGGSRVWIMDRTGAPGERLKAARDILEWYGYDLSRLRR